MPAIGAATPRVGKTHAKHCRLILDSTDLSGVSRQVGSVGVDFEANDIAGYSDAVHYFQLGKATHILNGYQAVFSNLATVGSHTELKDREEYINSFCIGVRGAPQIGSTAWLSSMQQISYVVEGTGAQLVSVDFEKAMTDMDHTMPWGTVLEAATALTASSDRAGVDNLAASTNGIMAHLHVVASDGGDWQFDIEESSDDENADNYASIATFTSDASAVASERIDVAGNVERYLRFAATRTSGTCTVWCTVIRGINLDA